MVRYIINQKHFNFLSDNYNDNETVFTCNGHVCIAMNANNSSSGNNCIQFNDNEGNLCTINGTAGTITYGWSYIIEFESEPAAGTGWNQFITYFRYIAQIPDILYTYRLKNELTYHNYVYGGKTFLTYDPGTQTQFIYNGPYYTPSEEGELANLAYKGLEGTGIEDLSAYDGEWIDQGCRTIALFSQPTDDLLQFLKAEQVPIITTSAGKILKTSTGKILLGD